MSVLMGLVGQVTSLLSYVLPLLFVLTVVVFIHELGHFWVGRRCGVGVKTFSLGFGPEIAAFEDRLGTRWRLAAIPLGGYVKFHGDGNVASSPDEAELSKMTAEDRARSFFHKPVAQRAAIVAAGPIANFILAIVIFAGIAYAYGRPVLTPRIEKVQDGSVAERAGFIAGDVVRSVAGNSVDSFGELQRYISVRPDESMAFVVDRGGRQVTLVATPALREFKTSFGTQRVGILGIQASNDPADFRIEQQGVVSALRLGVSETWFVVERTGAYLGGLFAGRESIDQMAGLPRIGVVAGQAAKNGFVSLLSLAALLSVSIGLMNLLPIPMLDGGHLAFYAVEAARGRPVSERTQEFGFRIGLAFVVMLVIFVTANDIWHLATLG